jgi:hypothetical protein
MAKRVAGRPEWLKAPAVVDIFSVSSCMSADFADYITFWKHNGYWLFDSPGAIRQLARDQSIDLNGTTLFYYEAYELEFDDAENAWRPFHPEPSFTTNVVTPAKKNLEGYDVVTFCMGNEPGCSPLSCNGLAREVETNRHCLLSQLDQAKRLIEEGEFRNSEPGPYRIFAVYSPE